MKRRFGAICILIPTVALLVVAAPAPIAQAAGGADPTTGPTVIPSLHNDVSAPLTALVDADKDKDKDKDKEKKEKPHLPIPGHDHPIPNGPKSTEPATPALASASAPALIRSFEGVGQGFTGPQGTFSVNAAPPDTNGAVGPNHYVQTVNTSFAVFNKTGTALMGPVRINTVWSGFGGGCQTNNDGDPSVVYDGIADRWVISQFSVNTLPYLMCVAVSTSPDPTGSYNRYSFNYGNTNFPDYPKLGVWPDGYYLTVNVFANGRTFTGAGVAALDRTRMLAGQPATQQLFTSQRLDSLADRLMYRLAYRNFGDHQSLVVNHSISAGSSVGVRWYELRITGGNPTVFQQGTYAPDSSYRWMGSIAMDRSGGIGLGFSVSSSSLNPQIHYTGRVASDPAGQMTQGEGTIINGAGAQTGRGLSRWGDYTSMGIDPADGCTFWYANEYIPANGAFNWSTRIGTFKLPGCGVTNDFLISASPSSVSATQNGSATSTIATAVTSGSAQTISLSASGLPSGATASFSPASVTAGSSSTLTLGAGAAA